LAAQLRGYALDDPEPSQRQALPAAVIEIVAKARATETHRAIGQLVTGAFFFAMRSCEYSEAGGSRRTKTVQIGDIVFRREGKTIDSAHGSALAKADTVSVTYRTQKNGDRGVTVTQHRTKTNREAVLCPVRALAELVSRISSYDLGETQWKDVATRPMNLVATFDSGTQVSTITSGEVLRHLRAAAIQYGEGRLGFNASRIGTHSLRAGAAMAMFLAGVPTETIQLIGRWRSQTFMRYIRIQVQQTTRGVADGMTTNPEFFTIDREDNGHQMP
jgi:Phage integrase family